MKYPSSDKMIDFMGESGVLWSSSYRSLIFLQALADASMMIRLKSARGEASVGIGEYRLMPGLKRDSFARSQQLQKMIRLQLIRPEYQGYIGPYNNPRLRLTAFGLEVLRLVKEEKPEGVIITIHKRVRSSPMNI